MPEDLFQFEDFVLNRGAYELRRGGVVVPLQRIPLELLGLLVERRGQVVTRAEILERVWGKGVFVDSETSINTAVRKLRRALGDNPEAPRFVATVPARGYRFVAPVRETNPARLEPSRVRLPRNPLVGREREMAKLSAGLEDAASGRGSLFLISGEPGVGKTRLADEVAVAANAKGMALLVGHCSDHDEAVAYLPFVEILENFTDRGSNLDSLRRAVGEQGPELARLLPKLKNLLPELAPPLDLPPAQARRHLFNCFCDFAARIACEQPALMILDDLHWADDSTLALLDHLTQRLSDLPLMVIGTHRDGEVNVTRSLAKTLEDLLRGRLATGVRLKGLPRDEVAAMLTSLSGKSPPTPVVGEIYAETEGNPFFVEELFLHLEEENRLYDSSGQFRSELKIAELDAPHNVRLVVGRRLARLNDPTQKILAAAAAIGRSFSFKLLEAAAATEGLLECLDEAQRAGLIFSGASSPEARFEFSHELIRQVLISGQSAARRQRLHLEVAQAMEQVYAGALDDHCADFAYHYDRGGDAGQAVEYLERAGVRAEQQLAYTEAIGYRTRALELLNLLPESPERDRGELELRQSLVRTLQVTRGFTAPETVDANKRAAALAEKSGNLTQLFTWVTARQVVVRESGDLAAAGALADQALELARREGSSRSILGMAHLLQIATCYQRGDLAGVERYFAEGLEFFDDPGMRQFPMAVIAAFGTASCNACLLGRADVARERMARMMASVDANNPYHLATSGMYAAMLRVQMREHEQAEVLAARALELADKHQFQETAANCRYTLGYARAQLGCATEGIALMRQGIAGLLELGNRSNLGGQTAYLAVAQSLTGRIGDALETVEQALAADTIPPRWPLIIRGELRLIQGQVELAETDFRELIALARSMNAKGLELIAATALARLLAKHGRRDEARSMLAEIYGWFTQGFDTADLKDAKALLDELNA
jgi:DNA-binding winged helix-turn-helix (wHTH) protein/tetratricopeptide (TPR) repeat protein